MGKYDNLIGRTGEDAKREIMKDNPNAQVEICNESSTGNMGMGANKDKQQQGQQHQH